MVTYKKKKVRKYRGSKTHGGGSMKKRRGAGHRGGRGNAGSGKRADQNKPSFLKKYGSKYFGRYGFKKKNPNVIKATTLDYLDRVADNFVNKKLIKKEKDTYFVNLEELGFDKLLGTGKVTKKFNIITKKATEKAVKKVKEAKGNIEIKEDKKRE